MLHLAHKYNEKIETYNNGWSVESYNLKDYNDSTNYINEYGKVVTVYNDNLETFEYLREADLLHYWNDSNYETRKLLTDEEWIKAVTNWINSLINTDKIVQAKYVAKFYNLNLTQIKSDINKKYLEKLDEANKIKDILTELED